MTGDLPHTPAWLHSFLAFMTTPSAGIVIDYCHYGAPVSKETVAIVDDDESMRQAIAALVQSFGYEALEFDTAEDLLASPRIRKIGCVISDLNMPGLSGIDLRRHLVGAGLPIPTIVVTAYASDRSRRLAAAAGITCFLSKPFSDQELIDCLHKAIPPKT
jgi:FixJ family two-component response regulator